LEDYRYDLDLQESVDDYTINFDDKPPTRTGGNSDPRPLRTLAISFRTDSSDNPSGVLDVTYLSTSGKEKWFTSKVAPVTNGKVSMSLPVPTTVGLFPDHLLGYWFAPENFDLSGGMGVFKRSITVVRAGVIHGNINPPPALANQRLSVLPIVIKPPTDLTITDLTSGTFNELSPKNDYVTQPLPFGGTYAVIVDAAPSYFVSESALVDAEHPLVFRGLDLKMPVGVLKGQFLDETGTRIRCTMHFAEFRIEDGFCVLGAAENCWLDPVPVELVDGRIRIAAA
ncbi:MAG: hypothetical protein ABSF34_21115, partial [Verrucomicrobiota bacterium]